MMLVLANVTRIGFIVSNRSSIAQKMGKQKINIKKEITASKLYKKKY